MIVKFFKGGRTLKGAKSAVGYLLNKRVEEGTAKVIKGDPNLTLKIISQIKNKWKFSSGVISFEEKINSSLLPQIIEEFEKVFFAGMDKDQYNILWVEHKDKGRTELHFIIPRIELRTWKAFNPYLHKKDLKKKDLFQDYINKKYNLKSPKQVERYATKAEIKWSNKNNELKKQINTYIEEAIGKGLVEDREDIVNLLTDAGFEITRKGKNYISVKLPDMQKAIRLKGAIYEENFSIRRAVEEERRRNKEYVSRELEEIRRELEERISKDAKYNERRYQVISEQDNRAVEQETGKHRLGIGTMQNSEKMEMGDRGRNSRSYSDLTDIEILDGKLSGKLRRKENRNSIQLDLADTKTKIEEDKNVRETIGRIRARRSYSEYLLDRVKTRIRENNQRAERVKTRDIELERIMQYANEIIKRIDRTLEQIKQLEREVSDRVNEVAREIKRIRVDRRAKMDAEIERFKTDINIADVAVDMGYEIDKRKSSRKSIVLKAGGDVIIVSRNSNGHYVYFNANNSKDAGTIIDFIQKRTGKNLGQVRKLLRQYLQSDNRIQLEISNTNEIKEYYKALAKFGKLWEELKANDRKDILLEDTRGIRASTLQKVDNLIYNKEERKFYLPVFNENGICGLYTLDRAMKEKFFIKGSIKGIWANRTLDKRITKIVITESPVDSLSAMELKRGDEDEDTTLHIATLGRMGQEAKETLKKVFKHLPDVELIIATDQDQAGEDIAREIAELARDAGLNNVNRLTFDAKDLNDYLQEMKREQEQTYAPSYSPNRLKFKR